MMYVQTNTRSFLLSFGVFNMSPSRLGSGRHSSGDASRLGSGSASRLGSGRHSSDRLSGPVAVEEEALGEMPRTESIKKQNGSAMLCYSLFHVSHEMCSP